MNQDPINYWEQLERLEKLIRASELKAGVIFSFHGLVLGIIVDRLEQLETVLNGRPIFIVLAVIWMILVFISIFFSFKCFNPQMEMKYDRNVFFFRNAAEAYGGIEEYTKSLLEVCGDSNLLVKQLAHQIHAESKIIDIKFKNVQKAIRFFGFSFAVLILMLLIWVLLMLL
jgi:uncharacterized protein YacL